jgi:hypothetical protein
MVEPADHPVLRQQKIVFESGFDTALLNMTEDDLKKIEDLTCMFCLGILNNPIECSKC